MDQLKDPDIFTGSDDILTWLFLMCYVGALCSYNVEKYLRGEMNRQRWMKLQWKTDKFELLKKARIS